MEKEILEKLAELQKQNEEMLAKIAAYSLLGAKNVLTAEDVVLLTGLKKSYLYKLTATQQIPHYKPNGKLVYFDREEIEQWQKQNRIATQTELEQDAKKYINLKK